MWCPTKNLGPIRSAVLTFIGYKQTDRQAKFICTFRKFPFWKLYIWKVSYKLGNWTVGNLPLGIFYTWSVSILGYCKLYIWEVFLREYFIFGKFFYENILYYWSFNIGIVYIREVFILGYCKLYIWEVFLQEYFIFGKFSFWNILYLGSLICFDKK